MAKENKNFPKGIPDGWVMPSFTIFGVDKNDNYYTPEFCTAAVDELIHHPLLWNPEIQRYDYDRIYGLILDMNHAVSKFSEKLMHNIAESIKNGSGLRIPKVTITKECYIRINLLMIASRTGYTTIKTKAEEFRDTRLGWNNWVSTMNSQIENANNILGLKIPEYETCKKLTETEEELEQTKKILKDTEHEKRLLRLKLDRIKDIMELN